MKYSRAKDLQTLTSIKFNFKEQFLPIKKVPVVKIVTQKKKVM
jgi:hypothetical protein